MRADAGYFAGQLARAAHDAHIGFAIGARRIAPLWRLLDGIAGDAWHDAIEMDGAQVAVAGYCPDWWPADTGC
jgi:basic membrane lipoprotein Med (substrate-binding protein (PBP1-ABC) superfamily)